jgi:hypothetical protein
VFRRHPFCTALAALSAEPQSGNAVSKSKTGERRKALIEGRGQASISSGSTVQQGRIRESAILMLMARRRRKEHHVLTMSGLSAFESAGAITRPPITLPLKLKSDVNDASCTAVGVSIEQ